MLKIKVSFDFDETLSRKDVQQYAKELIDSGNVEPHITTARCSLFSYDEKGDVVWYDTYADNLEYHKDIYKVADELGIPHDNITFTGSYYEYKALWLIDQGFLWHLDDCPAELRAIKRNGCTTGIDVNSFEWKENCDKLIKACL